MLSMNMNPFTPVYDVLPCGGNDFTVYFAHYHVQVDCSPFATAYGKDIFALFPLLLELLSYSLQKLLDVSPYCLAVWSCLLWISQSYPQITRGKVFSIPQQSPHFADCFLALPTELLFWCHSLGLFFCSMFFFSISAIKVLLYFYHISPVNYFFTICRP